MRRLHSPEQMGTHHSEQVISPKLDGKRMRLTHRLDSTYDAVTGGG